MAKDLTVEDYEDLALPETGLVPMRFLKGTITDLVGDLAGFEPLTAKRMHDEGFAEPIGAVRTVEPEARPASVDADDAARRGAVTISDNWADDHHLRRIALAKEIVGSDAAMKTDEADEIIKGEIARRASV